MHCSKCNAENFSEANFCYKCGKKLPKRKTYRINNKFLYDNINEEKIISLKNIIYKKILLSENRHRNIFILLAVMVLCSVLSIPICKGVPQSFEIAMSYVNTSAGQLSKEILKSQTELYFRDVFVRIALIFIFWGILIFNAIVLIYAYIKRNKTATKCKK